jgi:hypothetical protein
VTFHSSCPLLISWLSLIISLQWARQYTSKVDADKGLSSKMMKTSSDDADAEEDKDHDSAEDDGKSEANSDADEDGEEEREGMVRMSRAHAHSTDHSLVLTGSPASQSLGGGSQRI